MYLLGPGLDVCPPIQEDLDGLEAAYLSSTEECGDPTLTEIKRSESKPNPYNTDIHVYALFYKHKYLSQHTNINYIAVIHGYYRLLTLV